MNVVIDTSVWSLALRRAPGVSTARTLELAWLIGAGRVVMLGVIRQELLTGVRSPEQFARVREHLRAFPDLEVSTADHEEAAAMSNTCRAAGVQGSAVEYFICAVAARRRLGILTDDADFRRYAALLPINVLE